MTDPALDAGARGPPEPPTRAAPARFRRWRRAIAAAIAGLAVPSSANAQQFVVDDAPIVDLGACQLEVWHGRLAGWAFPACQPVANLEIAAGIGRVRDFEDGWDLDFAVQGKYVVHELEPNGFGISLVGGVGLGPLAQAMGRRFHEIYAYLPLSVSTLDERLVVHANAGWSMERERRGDDGRAGTRTHHHFTWGARADVALNRRFELIGEFFSEDGRTPEYQVGLRTILVPDRLLGDLSYGDRFRDGRDEDRLGLVIGLAWTPPPFF